MLAVPTPEQELLADTVRSLGAAVGVRNPQDLDAFQHEKAWAALAGTGLLGLRVRDDGQPEASGVDVMIVAQGLGAQLSPAPFLASAALAIELLELAGADRPLIDAIAAGDAQPGLLLDRGLTGLADITAGDGGVLIGGVHSDHALALRGNQVVRVQGPFGPGGGADLTSRTTRIAPGTELSATGVGEPLTPEAVRRWTALALTLVSADCAGAMRAAVDGVIEYSKQRIAYGVPIASFQALQHLIADAFTACEAAVTTTSYAAWAIDAAEPVEALLAARTAKAWVGAVARNVVETVMQIYGGIGQTWEHISHVYARRALLDVALFGDENYQLDQIFDLRREVG